MGSVQRVLEPTMQRVLARVRETLWRPDHRLREKTMQSVQRVLEPTMQRVQRVLEPTMQKVLARVRETLLRPDIMDSFLAKFMKRVCETTMQSVQRVWETTMQSVQRVWETTMQSIQRVWETTMESIQRVWETTLQSFLKKKNEIMMQRDASVPRVILNADTREEKVIVGKQEVHLSNRRSCHGTKLLKSSLRLAHFFVPCAGGTGHAEHQGHSEIYPSTLNVVSNCPSLGEYMQRSFTKCADVCGSYMQDGNCAYHCMRDSSKTKLVEFCAKPKPLFDYCPEYDPVDQTIQKDLATLCNSTFTRNYYNSSDIYFCDPNNCLQLRESSMRSGATTLTTLMNETTEMNDGDSQEFFVWLFGGLAALTLAIIIGYILHRVFVRLGFFSGRTRKMTKKRKQNGKQYVCTEKVIADYM